MAIKKGVRLKSCCQFLGLSYRLKLRNNAVKIQNVGLFSRQNCYFSTFKNTMALVNIYSYQYSFKSRCSFHHFHDLANYVSKKPSENGFAVTVVGNVHSMKPVQNAHLPLLYSSKLMGLNAATTRIGMNDIQLWSNILQIYGYTYQC